MKLILDPTGVGAPTLDRLFNFVFGKVFFGCFLRQRDKLLVGGETEADDLAHGQPGIEQLSGKHVVVGSLRGDFSWLFPAPGTEEHFFAIQVEVGFCFIIWHHPYC